MKSHYVDIIKGLLIVIVSFGLCQVDCSRLYHSIRGQSTLKLYVIYNVLEMADKLLSSFGLDILDSLLSEPVKESGFPSINPILHGILAIIYIFLHTIILLYQSTSLNAAVNSYSNALLTLLVSNQFVELKSAVFKKFERENLFQLACADVIERFQLSLYLFIIGLRNLVDLRHGFNLQNWASIIGQRLLVPVAVVYGSEIAVDWLKHAFITKFNHIQPDVFSRFSTALAKDFQHTLDHNNNAYVLDKSPLVARRIGFSVFPLGCLLIRVLLQQLTPTSWVSIIPHLLATFTALTMLKLISGFHLAAYCRQRTRTPRMTKSQSTDTFS